MTARSPSALLISTTLHGVVAALIILLVYAARDQVKEGPKILVIVLNDGANRAATEAPPQGTFDGVRIAIPEPPSPKPQPARFESPASTTATGEKPVRKATPAPVRHVPAENAAEEPRTTSAANSSPGVKHVDTEAIIRDSKASPAGDLPKSAHGPEASREQIAVIDAYLTIVIQRLRDGLEKPSGLGDAVSAAVEFRLNIDGSISGARMRQASGSAEFDRAVMNDLRQFGRIGPPSAWKGDTITMTFRMKDKSGG